jgi:hypothetical protein
MVTLTEEHPASLWKRGSELPPQKNQPGGEEFGD